MAFYNKGNAFKIAAMASKSCSAVSSRDLFVPISADTEVIDDGEGHRSYKVSATFYCYFGTRINIDNTFKNLKINGNPVSNVIINDWVSGDEPGKTLCTATFNGPYNYEGKPLERKINIEFSGSMQYYSDTGCTVQKEIAFNNSLMVTIDNIEPYYIAPDVPVIENMTATDSMLLVELSTTSFGEGGGGWLFADASRTDDFAVVRSSDTLSTLEGECQITNLQSNTEYYVRGVAANNGRAAISTAQRITTLTPSEVTSIIPTDETSIRVGAAIYSGGGKYEPTTVLEQSTDRVNWTSVGSTTAIDMDYFDVTGLTSGTTYYYRTKTTTTAGVYTSGYEEYTVPTGVWGGITEVVSSSGDLVATFTADSTGGNNISATAYYRPAGTEEEWLSSDPVEVAAGGTGTVTLTSLNPNYAQYEISLNLVSNGAEYNTSPIQVYTIPLTVNNNICSSLNYMVQLICQSLEAIKSGNILVYMNDDTKDWCEGEDNIPTLASIMSRVNRYMHSVGCVLCSMDGFIKLLSDSAPGQVFMGRFGWVDANTEVVADSENPVLSGAVYSAIQEFVSQVWHFVGDFDYYGANLLELRAQTPSVVGATGIVNNTKYVWNGSAWSENGTISVSNFGVIHINSGRHADKGYYWFVDDWNRLDASTEDIEAEVEALEDIILEHTFDDKDYVIAMVDSSMSDADIVTNVPTDATRDTIILITEDEASNTDVVIIANESQNGGNN